MYYYFDGRTVVALNQNFISKMKKKNKNKKNKKKKSRRRLRM